MKEYVSGHQFGKLSIEQLKKKLEDAGLISRGCYTKYDLLKRIDSALRFEKDWFVIAGSKGEFKSKYSGLI